MVNLYLILNISFLFLFAENLFSNSIRISYSKPVNIELLLIIGLSIFILVFLMIFLIIYFFNFKKRPFTNDIESVWNSQGFIEARNLCADSIQAETLNVLSNDKIKALELLTDFFNRIGILVYQGSIDFDYVCYLVGQDIVNYWENKNFKLYINSIKKRNNSSLYAPGTGFEYLVTLCKEKGSKIAPLFENYNSPWPDSLRSVYRRGHFSGKWGCINIILMFFVFIGFSVFIVFLISLLIFKGYM